MLRELRPGPPSLILYELVDAEGWQKVSWRGGGRRAVRSGGRPWTEMVTVEIGEEVCCNVARVRQQALDGGGAEGGSGGRYGKWYLYVPYITLSIPPQQAPNV